MCVASYSDLLNKPSPLVAYAAKTSSISTTEYQRRTQVREGSALETRGEILIQDLWVIQIDAIINVGFGDVDTDTYKYELMDKLLSLWDK